MTPVHRAIVRLLSVPVVTWTPLACGDDGSGLARDPFAPRALVSFERYVSLGNSVTSGVQSDGINDSTQSRAYPVLLSAAFGAPAFAIPALAKPGCTAPLVSLIPPRYLGGDESPPPCAGLAAGASGPFHNLAVPGYRVADLLTRPTITDPGDTRALQDLILPPGASAVQAMIALQPTFVTLWIGNNDVLAAALLGQPGLATPVPEFAATFRETLDSIVATGADAAVANVPDPVSVPALLRAPRLSGVVDTLRLLGLTNITVANCDDKAGWFVSLLAVAPALQGASVSIDCDAADPFGADLILAGPGALVDEVAVLRAMVGAYNDSIARAVADAGYALVDAHDFFARAAQAFGPSELVIRLQPFVSADFGPFFSLDGVHPSSFAQRALANAFIDAINAAYPAGVPPLALHE